ncbi:MAG: polysaccharide deacetylase family protein [Chthoniobacteraceae bacterium]
MPPTAGRALVVSLHDVPPRTRPACEQILAEIAALGVGACSLLVIPDHHHRGHFRADAEFCAWLAALAQAGHEVVTHGYFHQRTRRAGESTKAKWTTRIYTADEGEFYDLDRATARELIAKANAELRQLGLDPRGFIAPAWLLSAEAEAALRDLGVEYTTRLGSVLDLRSDTTHHSQSLVWSVRSGWRRGVSRIWNGFLFRHLAANPLMRFSIHPVDVEHPAIWQQIRALIARALADRRALTYHAWLGKLRVES